jgi:hypothetical protein
MKAVRRIPAMSAKPLATPPAYLVTSPTMMPPIELVSTGIRVHGVQVANMERGDHSDGPEGIVERRQRTTSHR